MCKTLYHFILCTLGKRDCSFSRHSLNLQIFSVLSRNPSSIIASWSAWQQKLKLSAKVTYVNCSLCIMSLTSLSSLPLTHRCFFGFLMAQILEPPFPEPDSFFPSTVRKKNILVSRTEKNIYIFCSLQIQLIKKEYKLHLATLISSVKDCYFQLYCFKKYSKASIF